MTTLVPDKHHPALDIDEDERTDYLCVVASMAFADATTDEVELSRVRDMCDVLGLSQTNTERVLASAQRADDTEIDAIISRLTSSDLRYALMIDAIDIAYADDEIVPEETAEIDALAKRLEIDGGKLALLRKYVAARTGHEGAESDPEATKRAAAALASAGVPAAGLAVAATLGAPILAGAGVAAALGVGSYMSVRWLLGRSKNKSAE